MSTKVYLAILSLVALFGVRDLFLPGFYDSHDGSFHLIRLYQFHLAVSHGQIPVRWAPTLFNGLGYPLFIVNYSLPYYLAELLYLLGLGLYGSFKALVILTYIASGLLMFQFLRYHFDSWVSFVGSSLFLFAPYRFASIFTRGALGEAVAVALLPMVFIAVQKLTKEKKREGIIYAILAISSIFLSHTLVLVISMPLLLLYALSLYKKSIEWTAFLFSFGVSIAISAFQLLPSIYERQFMQFDKRLLALYRDHFLSIDKLLKVPFVSVNDAPFQLGVVLTLLSGVAFILLVFYFGKKNTPWVFFSGVIISIFLASTFSRTLWEKLYMLSYILYPWRFLSVATFSAVFLAAWFVSKTGRFTVLVGLVICFGALWSARHFNKVTVVINRPEEIYARDKDTGTTENEFLPLGVNRDLGKQTYTAVEVIGGQGKITCFLKSYFQWRVCTDMEKSSYVQLGILDFPGWEVAIDGNKVTKNRNEFFNGLILVNVPKGKHTVTVEFKDTQIRSNANVISLLGFGILASIMVHYFVWKRTWLV